MILETVTAARVEPTMRLASRSAVGSNAKVLRSQMETEALLFVRAEGVGLTSLRSVVSANSGPAFEDRLAGRLEPTRAFARRFSSWQRRSASGCVELRLASFRAFFAESSCVELRLSARSVGKTLANLARP
jgi:hypothetical protein